MYAVPLVNYALIRILDYKEFELKLNAILSTGSGKSPRNLTADIGFDIATEAFWQKGIAQFAIFVNMLKETTQATLPEENGCDFGGRRENWHVGGLLS